jgi:arginine decarboxylase
MNKIQLRIPNEYFEFKGCGQSDTTIHAGSYHIALDKAGICMQNIMTYSSILPPSCYGKEVKYEDIRTGLLSVNNRGAVLECISAQCDSIRNEACSAGVAYMWIFEDEEMTIPYIGLVVERTGHCDSESIEEELLRSLRELKIKSFGNLYSNEDDIRYIISSFIPEEQHGTAIAGLAFINYKQ